MNKKTLPKQVTTKPFLPLSLGEILLEEVQTGGPVGLGTSRGTATTHIDPKGNVTVDGDVDVDF